MDLKPVDSDFAGKKPSISGKNSREQWKMEQHQSLYGNRLLDDGTGSKLAEYKKALGGINAGFKPRAKSAGKPIRKGQPIKTPNQILNEVRYQILRRGT